MKEIKNCGVNWYTYKPNSNSNILPYPLVRKISTQFKMIVPILVMEEEVPAKPKREKGKKALVKRIKKVF